MAAEVVTKVSPWSVEETVARLTALIAENRLKLFATFDQSRAAAEVGLALRDTKVVVFGSPAAGGRMNVNYASVDELTARYGLTKEPADRLRGIDAITDAVIHR